VYGQQMANGQMMTVSGYHFDGRHQPEIFDRTVCLINNPLAVIVHASSRVAAHAAVSHEIKPYGFRGPAKTAVRNRTRSMAALGGQRFSSLRCTRQGKWLFVSGFIRNRSSIIFGQPRGTLYSSMLNAAMPDDQLCRRVSISSPSMPHGIGGKR